MDIPQFFAWDDFERYSNGSVTVLDKQVSWAGAGVFVDQNVIVITDGFADYDDGTISTLDGGTGWAADGIFTTY